MKTPGENKVVPLLPRLITKKINLLFSRLKAIRGGPRELPGRGELTHSG